MQALGACDEVRTAAFADAPAIATVAAPTATKVRGMRRPRPLSAFFIHILHTCAGTTLSRTPGLLVTALTTQLPEWFVVSRISGNHHWYRLRHPAASDSQLSGRAQGLGPGLLAALLPRTTGRAARR